MAGKISTLTRGKSSATSMRTMNWRVVMDENELTELYFKCCDWQLSQELHKWGVPWDKRLCWVTGDWGMTLTEWSLELEADGYIPAHTESFLEGIIPPSIDTADGTHYFKIKENHFWHISYEVTYEKDGRAYEEYIESSNSKVTALAKMLLFILSNRLKNPEDLHS